MATAIVILIFLPEVIYANEAFCLYGYLLNYFQSSFIYNNARFKESTYGDTLLLRLKEPTTGGLGIRTPMHFTITLV
ncbi:MAG: hypothetical protein AMS17_20095 [Spirochaetes bacterium DG_61]|nr:MAG: hypothetical protein AMS17_20095 [Spirochaetes bacterium DG_61]